MGDKKEQEVSKSKPIGEKIDANKEKKTDEKKETKADKSCSKKKATPKNDAIACLTLIERPWEDMVITPMPGIPPLDWSPPYRPRRSEPLPYAESPEEEEELMFHLEMDYYVSQIFFTPVLGRPSDPDPVIGRTIRLLDQWLPASMKFLLLLVLVFYVTAEKKADKKEKKADLSHGFRTEIDWVKPELDHAIGIAKDLNKPILLLIHKTWCGACKGLKREFNTNPKMGDLIDLSKKFVMVNAEDDEEPNEAKYAPDGGYIPRIIFLDTDGELLSVKNDKRYPNNAYFYPLVPQVLDAMERALKEFSELETKEAGDAGDSEGGKAEDSTEEIKEGAEEAETQEEEVTEEEEAEDEKEEKKESKKKEKKEEKDEL